MGRIGFFAALLLAWTPLALAEDSPAEFFERKIRPVLVDKCYRCHSGSGNSLKANLSVDSREALRRGGDTGPAVVPGDPDKSLIIDALKYGSVEMPPSGKLPDNVIADFVKWVELGAPDPRTESAVPTLPVTAATIDWPKAREFWAFRPPVAHAQPPVIDREWVQRPLDGFILAALEAAGINPAAQADRRTLLRRVSFDLVGLPPTPEELERFEVDESPLAYEQAVDRLLASPHYGERWARLWLDVARYAEDQAHIVGANRELCYPNAYRYRDWVISALNEDLPYDRFIRQQLAADLINPDDRDGHVALGFLGLGPKYYRRGAPDVMAEEWEDRVDTVTRGLLGLTVACARCHHHKYDPIPTEDYYALTGVFASTEMFNRPLSDKAETSKGGQAKKSEEALHILRDQNPRDINVMIRGDVAKKGPVVERHFLTVLCPGEPDRLATGSGRLDLANSITRRDNPLTARVIVNRMWAQFFKAGLVKTMSNFGALGERPTHPELLDDLAVRFMDSGWSIKWLAKEIVLSSTYRQSSHVSTEALQLDPDNRLLSRMPRRRLSVEAWRDSLLAVAGELEPAVGGPSIQPTSLTDHRRTIYSEISRLELNRLLALFDFPDPNTHNPQRNETTTPLQKLFVLNSPFMLREAEAARDRIARETATAPELRVVQTFRVLLGRHPTADEEQMVRDFLGETPTAAHWAQFTQALLACNEFLILD